MDRRERDSAHAEKIKNGQKQVRLIMAITAVETETEESVFEVASLLGSGVDLSARDFNRWLYYYSSMNYSPPLHYASRNGAIKTMELLLKYKANPNAKDRYYVTPLHLAAKHGHEQCVKRLIEAGAVVDAKTHYTLPNATVSKHAALPYKGGTTPLHLAAAGNHIACVESLMLEGADYNAVNCEGETSLYIAARRGFPDCVLMQLHIANTSHSVPILSIPTNTGDTPLHQCLRQGKKMWECVKMLIQHGSDVSFSNECDQTPIHIALRHQWDDDVIKLLVLEGYNMDFDRKSPSYDDDGRQRFDEDSYNHSAKNPLELLISGEVRAQSISENEIERKKDLAVFFIKVGASRDLLDILAIELCSNYPAGPILNAVMDSFAYLPPLKDVLSREKLVRHRFFFPALGHRQPFCAERKKKEADYLSRAKEVPSLQHLCRIAVRMIMQQQIRKVTCLPLPTIVKEYILLELKIPESPV